VHVLAAAATRGVFQVDGWGPLRVGVGYASVNGQFQRGKHAGEWRLLGSYYQDGRRTVKTDSRPLDVRRGDMGNIRIGTYGGHYLHLAPTGAGPVDLMLFGVVQTGKWGRLTHRAAAVAVEAGWQPPVAPRLKPWLRGGYFHGSGDGDPNDGRHGTFFPLLLTPRLHARMPFFNTMNNRDAFGSLMLRPHAKLTVRGEFHHLCLAERRDLWYLGGGAFQPWTFGFVGRPSGGSSSLANFHDVSAEIAVNPHVMLGLYYGYAAGRSVIGSVYPKGRNGSLGYLELTYRF
jgi:hypothetical protein